MVEEQSADDATVNDSLIALKIMKPLRLIRILRVVRCGSGRLDAVAVRSIVSTDRQEACSLQPWYVWEDETGLKTRANGGVSAAAQIDEPQGFPRAPGQPFGESACWPSLTCDCASPPETVRVSAAVARQQDACSLPRNDQLSEQEMFPSPDVLRLFNLMLGTCFVSHFSGAHELFVMQRRCHLVDIKSACCCAIVHALWHGCEGFC